MTSLSQLRQDSELAENHLQRTSQWKKVVNENDCTVKVDFGQFWTDFLFEIVLELLHNAI